MNFPDLTYGQVGVLIFFIGIALMIASNERRPKANIFGAGVVCTGLLLMMGYSSGISISFG